MIITLCGSARFEPWFVAWNEALSLSGHLVFGLAVYPSNHEGKKEWYTLEQKTVLDAVHKGKIEVSHAILVLNVFAYIGESTMSEIQHAKEKKKEVRFLQSWGKGNGVGVLHDGSTRARASFYRVPEDYRSPIDTFNNRDLWGLLPPAGVERNAIVEGLKRHGV